MSRRIRSGGGVGEGISANAGDARKGNRSFRSEHPFAVRNQSSRFSRTPDGAQARRMFEERQQGLPVDRDSRIHDLSRKDMEIMRRGPAGILSGGDAQPAHIREMGADQESWWH